MCCMPHSTGPLELTVQQTIMAMQYHAVAWAEVTKCLMLLHPEHHSHLIQSTQYTDSEYTVARVTLLC